VQIVPAASAEATALGELHLTTWRATYGAHAHEAWYGEQLAAHVVRDWSETIRSHLAKGGGLLSARCDGRPVGLCQYGPSEDRDDDPLEVGQVQRLYVHPARQRTGIGRALLGAAMDRLREAGSRTATLWVLETDARARAFYEALGWRPDGARTDQLPKDLRLRLPLR
jgi:GNAT superfamily N-acetyltransferase